MNAIRRSAWVALILGFGHVVFGAIVRITGSGMGCGDHWPKCHGYWIPPMNRPDLIVEVSHRYFAALLTLAVIALLTLTWQRRHLPGVSGRHGLIRPAALSAVLVVAAALFGAATVKLELTNKAVIVIHLSIAMALLATLVVAIVRAGGLGASRLTKSIVSEKTSRAAIAAAGLAFLAIVLGALTAHIPGANVACQGFPLCRGGILPSDPSQHIQFAHRMIAFLLLFHLAALSITVPRRGERFAGTLARLSLGSVVVQIVVAAVMVEMQLPAVWRSAHEAVGTFVWLVIVVFALLTRRGAMGEGAAVPARRPSPTLASAAEATA